jgi:hypothetical protein
VRSIETKEKVKRFIELFHDDPLYLKIESLELTEKLFENCLLYEKVFFDDTYSTKQAAELLEIPGQHQTLINLLNRYDLNKYIQILRQGTRGIYRFDYKTLFQFKMILLLSDEGYTPLHIANLVGTQVLTEELPKKITKREGFSRTIQDQVNEIVHE